MERVDTIVVGAGQAGLSASYVLTQHSRDHVVLERGQVANTWRTERWDDFVLNTPNWAQLLPGFEYAGDDPDAFAPTAEVVAYLDDYAASFSAPVRERVEVLRVSQVDVGFEVETSEGLLSCVLGRRRSRGIPAANADHARARASRRHLPAPYERIPTSGRPSRRRRARRR